MLETIEKNESAVENLTWGKEERNKKEFRIGECGNGDEGGPVTKPAEVELAAEGAAESHAIDGGGDVGREDAGFLRQWVVVVEPTQQTRNTRNAKEIISVGEESHSGDEDGGKMIPLGARFI